MMALERLVQCLFHFKWHGKKSNPNITSLEMDSRRVKPGSLFICLPGFTVDGHDFADEAVQNGASAIVAERKLNVSVPVLVVRDTRRAMALLASHFYDYPTTNMTLFGVTGTNGKTTVTHLIEQVLRYVGKKTGMIGTLYTKIGDIEKETKNTTPESLVLQQTFAHMKKEKVEAVAMEVSSHALDLGRTWGCDFDIAVFTNLSRDHLDYHETMEAYLQAKSLLFSQLGNGSALKQKIAVINGDDPAASALEKAAAVPMITYGIEGDWDVVATAIETRADGTFFELKTPSATMPINLKLIGRFSVYNALATIAACMAANIPLEAIKESLEQVTGVPGRFEPIQCGQPYAVIVDYAHTPDSLKNVLQTVNELTRGQVYVVVGCGGDRDQSKRPLMADIATKFSTKAIFTSDNPRNEKPQSILKDMEQGVHQNNYVTIENRREAIYEAIQWAKKDDTVIIAGKGHETYQIVGNNVHDFDDRLVAKDAILIKQKKSKE